MLDVKELSVTAKNGQELLHQITQIGRASCRERVCIAV